MWRYRGTFRAAARDSSRNGWLTFIEHSQADNSIIFLHKCSMYIKYCDDLVIVITVVCASVHLKVHQVRRLSGRAARHRSLR